jgi:thiol-disulfide isomerase/thioredoxin
VVVSKGQGVKVVNYSSIQKEINSNSDTIKIFNFWATFCKPCVEELPYFVEAQKKFSGQKVKFIYVSLDFSKQLDKVEQYVQNKGLKGEHFLLKDDPNYWINEMDKNWGGDIPYTLLITKSKEYIRHGTKFNSSEELFNLINQHLN